MSPEIASAFVILAGSIVVLIVGAYALRAGLGVLNRRRAQAIGRPIARDWHSAGHAGLKRSARRSARDLLVR